MSAKAFSVELLDKNKDKRQKKRGSLENAMHTNVLDKTDYSATKKDRNTFSARLNQKKKKSIQVEIASLT